MKKFLTLMFVVISLSAYGEPLKIADLFRAMPDSILPVLSKNNRLDFIDYLENNMQARVRNHFDEYSEMTVLKDTYLHIKLSDVSEVDMKLLTDTVSHDSLICLVRSYSAPARESVVEFYDKNWVRQNWVELPSPSVDTFWETAPDSVAEDVKHIQAELKDIPLIGISAEEDKPVLVYTLQTNELEKKERDLTEQYMHPLEYIWTGTSFKEKK